MQTFEKAALCSSCGRRFTNNFRFNTFCNITRVPQELQRYNCAKSTVIKYHQLPSKVIRNSVSNSFFFHPSLKELSQFGLRLSHCDLITIFKFTIFYMFSRIPLGQFVNLPSYILVVLRGIVASHSAAKSCIINSMRVHFEERQVH